MSKNIAIEVQGKQKAIETIQTFQKQITDEKIQEQLRKIREGLQSKEIVRDQLLQIENKLIALLKQSQIHDKTKENSQNKMLIQYLKSQLNDAIDIDGNIKEQKQIKRLMQPQQFTWGPPYQSVPFGLNFNTKKDPNNKQQILDMNSEESNISSHLHVDIDLGIFLIQHGRRLQQINKSGCFDLELQTPNVKIMLSYIKEKGILRINISQYVESNQIIQDCLTQKLQFSAMNEIALKSFLKCVQVRKIQPIITKQSQLINLKMKLYLFLRKIGVDKPQIIPIQTKDEQCIYAHESYQDYDQYSLRYQLSSTTQVALRNITNNIKSNIFQGPINTSKYVQKIHVSWKHLQNLRRLFPTDEYIKEIEYQLLNDFPKILLLENEQIFVQTVQILYKHLNKQESMEQGETLFDILPSQQTEIIAVSVDQLLAYLIQMIKILMQQINSKQNSYQYICSALKITRGCNTQVFLQDMVIIQSKRKQYEIIIKLIRYDLKMREKQLRDFDYNEVQRFLQELRGQQQIQQETPLTQQQIKDDEGNQIPQSIAENLLIRQEPHLQDNQQREQNRSLMSDQSSFNIGWGSDSCEGHEQRIQNDFDPIMDEERVGQLTLRIGQNIDRQFSDQNCASSEREYIAVVSIIAEQQNFPIRRLMLLLKLMKKYKDDGFEFISQQQGLGKYNYQYRQIIDESNL